MPRLNESYLNLRANYLFAEIRRRTDAFAAAHPDARLIDLGIGDVTRPLPAAVVRALHEAADELTRAETFRGYGPYVGYEFLRRAIAEHDFGARGVKVGVDEVFISDGGKSDSANLQELFAPDCVVALMDPVYPVYADSNVVAGRSGPADESGRYAGFVYLPCTAENVSFAITWSDSLGDLSGSSGRPTNHRPGGISGSGGGYWPQRGSMARFGVRRRTIGGRNGWDDVRSWCGGLPPVLGYAAWRK